MSTKLWRSKHRNCSFWLTPKQVDILTEAAERKNQSRNDYIRDCVAEDLPGDLFKLWMEEEKVPRGTKS
jgi:hypothetical protein